MVLSVYILCFCKTVNRHKKINSNMYARDMFHRLPSSQLHTTSPHHITFDSVNGNDDILHSFLIQHLQILSSAITISVSAFIIHSSVLLIRKAFACFLLLQTERAEGGSCNNQLYITAINQFYRQISRGGSRKIFVHKQITIELSDKLKSIKLGSV